jgi:hypothetical protein
LCFYTLDQIWQEAGEWLQDRMEHIALGEQQFGLFGGKSPDEVRQEFPTGIFCDKLLGRLEVALL